MSLRALHTTLDQELLTLMRGASLECVACGEFVMHAKRGIIVCPQCGSLLLPDGAAAELDPRELGLQFGVQAG